MSRKTKAELLAENTELLQQIDTLRQALKDCHRLRVKNRGDFARIRKEADQRQNAGMKSIHGDTTEKRDFIGLRFAVYRNEHPELGIGKARYLANFDTEEQFGSGYSDRYLIDILKD